MLKTAAVALCPLALVAYLLLWPHAPVTEGDSPQYLEVARDLADGRLDSLHDRTPGYPALLVVTASADHPTRMLFVAGLILHLAAVWLLAAVLQTAGVGRHWVLGFVVLLLLPPYVETAANVMTENLAQFTLAAGFAALVFAVIRGRLSLIAVAVIAFAAASLTRPIYQALAPALAVSLVVVAAINARAALPIRRATLIGVLLVVGTVLVLGSYASVNRVRFGFFGVTHTIGFHLSTKTMGFVERLPEEYAIPREIFVNERNAQLTRRGGTHTGTQTIWSVRPQLAEVTGLGPPDLSRYLLGMNLRLIAIAPIEYLQEVARSIATYWFPAAGPLANLSSSVLRWTWALLHAAVIAGFATPLIVLLGLALFDASGRLALRGGPRRLWWAAVTQAQALAYTAAATIVMYNMVLSCFVDIGEPRQRRPTDIFIAFMFVLGAHMWREMAGAAAATASPRPVSTLPDAPCDRR